MVRNEDLQRHYKLYRLLFAGALGLAVVIVVQYLEMQERITVCPLILSIHCFAVSIPVLAMCTVVCSIYAEQEVPHYAEQEVPHKLPLYLVRFAGTIGLMLFFLGLTAGFLYLSVGAGILFVLMGVLMYSLYVLTTQVRKFLQASTHWLRPLFAAVAVAFTVFAFSFASTSIWIVPRSDSDGLGSDEAGVLECVQTVLSIAL